MSKYDYKDIIVDPSDPRVEIGAEYFYSDKPKTVLNNANNGGRTGTLKEAKGDAYVPFTINCPKGPFQWTCIIRKKEPSYVERQAKWIADNDIKRGDKVRIARKADSYEDGWGCRWNPDMDKAVGNVGSVCHISSNLRKVGIEIDVPDVGPFLYPYFVLKKVGPRYVPFDLSKEEDRARLRGTWVREKDEVLEYQVIAVGAALVSVDGDMFNTKVMLERYEFLDGSPCGKLVEEVENEAQ